ncbi:hypothetical protein DP122_05000 [Clostridium tetani]|uniref:hypothetical protein n=1 Tax=Clostridium tetani TaxID=1513 RepID=UPI00100C04FD|nr:hypothetical protein [Clostridium tetani]RXI55266.1 hypothetical protein DP122_05000 [Clostridium tetani]RXM69413.1 hypothetical protein DP139_10225 [Clostridium tetani]
MKITAEFNSSEELISFINTFGANALKGVESKKEVQEAVEVKETKKETVTEKKGEVKQVDPPKEGIKKELVIEKKEEIKKEEKSNPLKNEQVKTPDTSKEKITKEMIRATFAKLIKAGKAKEAKDITTKYGAKKVPDLKEEDYTAILKEVEEIL